MAELEDSIRDVLAPLRVTESSTVDDVVKALASLVLRHDEELNRELNKTWIDTIHAVFPDFDEENEFPGWSELHAEIASLRKRNSDLTDGSSDALKENEELADELIELCGRKK